MWVSTIFLLVSPMFSTCLSHYHIISTFNNPEELTFENIVEREENVGNQYFLLFPQCFLISKLSKANFSFGVTFILSSAKLML